MLVVRLPEDIENRLSFLAKETGRTKSFYVRQALEAQLEDMEDLLLAESRMAAIRAGQSKTYPLAEVMKEYGLEV